MPGEDIEHRDPEHSPASANAATAGRRLLFWLVTGLMVLNLLLFLKFGLDRKPGSTDGSAATNSAATAAATNAVQKTN